MAKLRRGKLKRKTLVRRRANSLKPKPGSDFRSFFLSVVGRESTTAERIKLKKQLEVIQKEIKNPGLSLKRIGELWNQAAKTYKKLIEWRRLQREAEIISAHGGLNPGDSIASIGSGPAILESYIAKRFVPSGRVTCVDISPEMSKLAQKTKEKTHADNLSVLTASGTATGLPVSSQDKVILIQTNLAKTVHWWPLLQEVRRILKKTPESKFFVSFATNKKTHYSISEISEGIRSAGFEIEARILYAAAGEMEARMLVARIKSQTL